MTDFDQTAIRKALVTVFYYVVVISIVWLAAKQFPSGPCTPNLDVLSFLVAIVISLILWIRKAFLTFAINKVNVYSLIVHTMAWICGFILIMTDSF